MQTYETVKLFYDEYPYKIVIRNGLVRIFREKNLAHAKSVLDNLQNMYDTNSPLQITRFRRIENISHSTFIEAKNLYIELSQNIDYKLRVENVRMQVYSHEYSWLQMLSQKFNATEFWQPRVDIDELGKNTIIVNTPPLYQYKVHLGTNVDPNLAQWIVTNPGKARAGTTCLDAIKQGHYCKGLYFYVRDDKILQLLNLFIGKVQRIDKLVYIAKTDK